MRRCLKALSTVVSLILTLGPLASNAPVFAQVLETGGARGSVNSTPAVAVHSLDAALSVPAIRFGSIETGPGLNSLPSAPISAAGRRDAASAAAFGVDRSAALALPDVRARSVEPAPPLRLAPENRPAALADTAPTVQSLVTDSSVSRADARNSLAPTLRNIEVQAGASRETLARTSTDQAKAYGGSLFEGLRGLWSKAPERVTFPTDISQKPRNQDSRPGVVSNRASWLSRFRRSPAALKQAAVPAPPGRDEFGGPRSSRPAFWDLVAARKPDIGEGFTWGFLMLGMLGATAILKLVFGVVVGYMAGSAPAAHVTGGVDPILQQNFGDTLTHAPWTFLFQAVPAQVFKEEIIYRFLVFGGLFLGLTRGVRPLARRLSTLFIGARTSGLRAWLGRRISSLDFLARHAFFISALAAGAYFSAQHFALWGMDPVGFVIRTVFGYAMAWSFYKTRSLVAPTLAHWLYDALQFFGAVLVLHFGLPPVANTMYMALLLTFSLAFSWHYFRSAIKARRAARNGAFLE